jgi:hypothetical protein
MDGNAAEFYDATHHIWVNGVQTFEQHNWYDCNPNPDGCQPQNGTWYYNRAGWCPGTIAQWYDYNMTPYVAGQNVELKYIFYENYVDLCHPNHPDCVTGVTCSNCADGFNPVLDVACNLVVFAHNPVYAFGSLAVQTFPIQLLTIAGTMVGQYAWDGKSLRLDLSQYPRGMYILKIRTQDRTEMKKLLLQ